MAKVMTMARFTSMPIRAAVGASSETARMAVPSFVRMTKRYRPTIISTAEPTTTTSSHLRRSDSAMGSGTGSDRMVGTG